jgi:hypothetical protein
MQRPRENKRQVTMRFDADVLEFFKRAGRGCKGMNACSTASWSGTNSSIEGSRAAPGSRFISPQQLSADAVHFNALTSSTVLSGSGR